MKWIWMVLVIWLPMIANAQSYDAVFDQNRTIVQVQQETDNAVRWISMHGYNDDVAYQFMRRCVWLRITPGGYDWCNSSSAHRGLLQTIWSNGSPKTIRMLKQYRALGQ